MRLCALFPCVRAKIVVVTENYANDLLAQNCALNCIMVTLRQFDELSSWEKSVPQRKFRQEFPVRWSEQKRFFGIE